MTDRYPNRDAVARFGAQGDPQVRYLPDPVDATELASAPAGLKTMINCFHHMRPAQARAILEMRLSRLTGLEREKLATEYGEICQLIAELRAILASDTRLLEVITEELQEIRARLENLRLQAEVIIPAEFARQARAIEAIGRAAPTKENGEAAVEVLRMMTDAWKSMGNQARELYVIQHLEDIVGTVVDQLDNIEIDEVNVLDLGDGQGLSSYAATYPKMVAEVMNALKETTGVDVTGILKGEENSGQTRRASVMPPRGV